MKRLLAIILSVSTALGQVNVQKASGTNEISGSLVVGSGKTLTATGTGTIVATGGTASTVPWSGVTGTPTTLAGYGITSPLLPTVGGTGQSTWTLGDFLYANGTNTLAKLPGSTSATLAVLTQTGNGTVSAAPAWVSTTGTGNVVRATSPTLTTPTATGSVSITGSGATLNLGTETTAGTRIVQFGSTYGSGSLAFQNGATVVATVAPTGVTSNVGFRAGVGSGPTAVDYGWSGASGLYSPTANNISIANNNARVANFSTTALILDYPTSATTTTSGALQVAGGAGIVGDTWLGGILGFGTSNQLSLNKSGLSLALQATGTNIPTFSILSSSNQAVLRIGDQTQAFKAYYDGIDFKINDATANYDMMTFQKSGTASTGTIRIPMTTPATAPNAGAFLVGDTTSTGTVAIGRGQVAIGGGNLSTNAQAALSVAPTITPISGNIYGLKMDVSTLSGASAGTVNPVSVAATNTGTTNVANQTVFQSTVNQSATSGTLTNAINYRAANALLNAGIVGNIYGFRFVDTYSNSTGGVVANQYAFYAEAMTRGTVNNYAFYSEGSTPSYFGGNVQVGGTSFQVLSANNAKTTVDNSGSSSLVGLNSNTAGNYRTLKFSYGATPTTLWQIGYQGGTASTNLNFEPSDPSYEAVFFGTGASTNTTSGALQSRGGLGVAGAAWVGGTANISTGASDAFLSFITSGTTAAQTIQFQDSGGGSGAISYSHTTNALSFKTNGTTWASLNNAGAMQIGSVAAPTYGTAGKLYVYGGPARLNLNGADSTWIKGLTLTPTGDNFRHVHQYAWSNTGNSVATKWVKEINGTETDMMTLTDGNLAVSGTGTSTFAGAVSLSTAGTTVSIKSGTNAAAGTVTLVAGNGTITSTAIDVNTVIVMSIKTKVGSFDHAPSVVVAAGSATIDGHNSDDSTYNWIALKVN